MAGRNPSKAAGYLVATVSSIFLACISTAASALVNPGFENGVEDGAPDGWQSLTTDAVVVVDTETAPEFPVYGELGGGSGPVVVSPYRGDLMLRLGSPKDNSNSRPKGPNAASQVIDLDGSPVNLALRIFSFDSKRRDTVVINLSAAGAGGDPWLAPAIPGVTITPVSISTQGPKDITCDSASPALCTLKMDVGGSGDSLDSGWLELTIDNLPDTGQAVLSYTLLREGDSSSPTWTYFDGPANKPPEAVIRYNPKNPVEGGDVVLFDCTDSTDPNGDDLTCSWEVSGCGLTGTVTNEGPVTLALCPDDGTLTVKLTVTDDSGETNSTASTTINPTVVNAAPLVKALDLEVAQNETGELLCRWADIGYTDLGTVTFSVGGPATNPNPPLDTQPPWASGFGTALFDDTDAPGELTGETCSVVDGDGGSASDSFEIRVLSPAQIAAFEPADGVESVDAPPQLVAGGIYRRALDSPDDDLDIFEIVLTGADGNPVPVPPNAEVRVKVTPRSPVDIDAALFTRRAVGSSGESSPYSELWITAPYSELPYSDLPYSDLPYSDLPYSDLPYSDLPYSELNFIGAAFGALPYSDLPYSDLPYSELPYSDLPYSDLPYSDLAPASSPYSDLEAGGLLSVDNFRFGELGAVPPVSSLTSADTPPDELGAFNLGVLRRADVRLETFSANFAPDPEEMLIKVAPGTETVLLAVIAQPAGYQSAGYSVQVEVHPAQTELERLGVAACTGEPVVTSPISAGQQAVSYASGSPRTLVITQQDRYIAAHGDELVSFADEKDPDNAPHPEAAAYEIWHQHMAATVYGHEKIQAKWISLDPGLWTDPAHGAADVNVCSVEAQNLLAEKVKEIIWGEIDGASSIEYIVFLGDPSITSAFYGQDQAGVGYEGNWKDIPLRANTPMAVAIREGNQLIDGYFGDKEGQIHRNGAFWLEDVVTARIAGGPVNVALDADDFDATDGVITLNNALVMSSEFMDDGAAQVVSSVDDLVTVENYNTGGGTGNPENFWDASDMRRELLSQCAEGETCTAYDARIVDVHANYNGLLPARESFTEPPLASDAIVRSDEAGDSLAGVLVDTIGCHARFVVPPLYAFDIDPNLAPPSRGWEAEQGLMLGYLTYGIGETEGIAGSEAVQVNLWQALASGLGLPGQGTLSVGKALLAAKVKHAMTQAVLAPEEEKAIVGYGVGGWPQYQLANTPATGSAAGAIAASLAAGPASAALPTGLELALTVTEEGVAVPVPPLSYGQVNTDNGVYYTLNGDAEFLFTRPVLPLATIYETRSISDSPSGTKIHSAITRALTWEDIAGVDPAISTKQHTRIVTTQEPQICLPTFAPTESGLVTTLPRPGDTLQTVLYRGAQFRCDVDLEDPNVTTTLGTYKLFTSAGVDLLHPSDPDFDDDHIPPELLRIDAVSEPVAGSNINNVTVTLEASDENGIREYIVQRYRDNGDGTGFMESFSSFDEFPGDTPPLVGPRTFQFQAEEGDLLGYYIIDRAGNALSRKARGRLYDALFVDIVTEFIVDGGSSTLSVLIEDPSTLTEPQLFIDIGNGAITEVIDINAGLANGSLVCGPPPDPETDYCLLTFDYPGLSQLPAPVTVTVTVLDAAGRSGTDTDVIEIIEPCDEAGDLSPALIDADIHLCPVTFVGDEVRFEMVLTEGGEASADYQYRLNVNGYNIKLNDLRKITAPEGVTLTGPFYVNDGVAGRIRFQLSPQAIGWDGVSPIALTWETQAGIKGKKQTGFIDQGSATAP